MTTTKMNFQPIFFTDFLEKDQIDPALFESKEAMERGFSFWAGQFGVNARNFYLMQHQRHEALLLKSFMRENDLDPEISLDEYDSPDAFYEFKDYVVENDLDLHGEWLEDATAQTEAWESRSVIAGGFDCFGLDFMDSPPVDTEIFSALWFNRHQEKPETIKRLRSLAYLDYLKSSHWLYVRATMFVIHGARCQHDHCVSQDSGWGYEHHYHVHHLTYVNRGNERYADLQLLCDQHHKEVHGK